jgi:hypothetical protein
MFLKNLKVKNCLKINALQGPTFNVCEDLRGKGKELFLMPVQGPTGQMYKNFS